MNFQGHEVGFPAIYEGRLASQPYYPETPTWSRQYNFCHSDQDCKVNAGASRCMSINGFRCDPATGPCLCQNAVNASRIHGQRRDPYRRTRIIHKL
jgi:hypothetical protein